MATNLVEMLLQHARASIEASPTNLPYAERVTQNASLVGELIVTQTGEISTVVATWRGGFKPFAEAVFGLQLELRETDTLQYTHATYAPTVLEGIVGRVARLSDDEIMGPLLSLDLRAVP